MNYVAGYFGLIPPELLPASYIVSGAVIDALMATDTAHDVDIVILKLDVNETWENFEERVLVRLRAYNPTRVIEEVRSKDGKYQGFIKRHLCNILGYFNRLSTIEDKRVEILLSDADDIKKVLAGFDLSIHQIAFRPDFHFVRAATCTSYYEPIQVTDWGCPANTLERYLRLCKRYDQQPDTKITSRLHSLIHEAEKENS